MHSYEIASYGSIHRVGALDKDKEPFLRWEDVPEEVLCANDDYLTAPEVQRLVDWLYERYGIRGKKAYNHFL